jgi:hypothetical protein
MQVAPEDYEYGYTPEHTVDEQEYLDRQKFEMPIESSPSAAASPSVSPPRPDPPASDLHAIDPSLLTNNIDAVPSKPRKLAPFRLIPKTSKNITVTMTPNTGNPLRQQTSEPQPRQFSIPPTTPNSRLLSNPLSSSSNLSNRSQVPTASLALPPDLIRTIPVTIPKAFTDRIMQQEAHIASLELKLAKTEAELHKFQERIELEFTDIDNEQTGILQKFGTMEMRMLEQNERIEELVALINNLDTTDRVDEPHEKVKARRNNALNVSKFISGRTGADGNQDRDPTVPLHCYGYLSEGQAARRRCYFVR